MAISEAKRFEMHLGLKETLGDNVADTLMEHLPHGGASRVADKDEFQQVNRKLNLMLAVGVGAIIAILAMQVQIIFSIADLSASLGN